MSGNLKDNRKSLLEPSRCPVMQLFPSNQRDNLQSQGELEASHTKQNAGRKKQ